MWEQIRIGDYVRQRAGGPVMHVQAFDGSGKAYCVWEKAGKRQTGLFLKSELAKDERYEEDPNARPELN